MTQSICAEENFYSYGQKTSYDRIETIHECVKIDYEECHKAATSKLLEAIGFNEDINKIKDMAIYYKDVNEECLNDKHTKINECYLYIYNSLLNSINNATDYPSLKQSSDYSQKSVDKCERVQENNCKISTFVVNNIRSCVNEAINDYYREVYSGFQNRKDEFASSDVSSALTSLQQNTVKYDKLKMVTGNKYLRHLDLIRDRLEFCSEMINKDEARGI